MIPTVPFVHDAMPVHLTGCIMRHLRRIGDALREQPALTSVELTLLITCPCCELRELLSLGRFLGVIPPMPGGHLN